MGYRVVVLGATGAVGQEFLRLFEERDFPIEGLSLLASERSAGKTFCFRGKEVPVVAASPGSFEGCQIAFFSAGAPSSREFAPSALDAGAVVIDNSSAFRMHPDVPLTVPEINAQDAQADARLFAVPNCTAIILTMSLAPIAKLGKISRVVVSTYQSASGGGAAMMNRLIEETHRFLASPTSNLQPSTSNPYPQTLSGHPPYAFNLFSHNTPIREDGLNEEEGKVVEETRKIMGTPDLKLNVTCIRVPVLRAHSESITVEFDGKAPSVDAVRTAVSEAPGLRLVDDRATNRFPTPLEASGTDDVLVGRIRVDPSHPSAISLFVSGDQLRKGAALNGVQIAEWLIAQGRI